MSWIFEILSQLPYTVFQLLSRLLCDHSFNRNEKQPWKEIEDEAEHLHELPSWNVPDNSLMFQAFEWHVPDDQAHWRRLRRALPTLEAMGFDNIWIPPGCKAANPSGNGYDIYDLYDLGEFDQKGSQPTKWGTKEELQSLVSRAQDFGIGIYWDAVLNHKAGADYSERFSAVRVDPQNRNIEISPAEDIESWVGFSFPGRDAQYSSLDYHWYHFTGVDWDELRREKAIFKTTGPDKEWAPDVSDENGNYDYLMFSNVDYPNAEVREDVLQWGSWITTQLPLSGMRLDAVKHYSAKFQRVFIDKLRESQGEEFFIVGEYWKAEIDVLLDYLERMEYRLSMFDVPLLANFSSVSHTEGADMRRIFHRTLVQQRPEHAVTFVANHDTQPGQSLEAPIAPFFKPLAYALILLREKGQPCVFYGDIYGIATDKTYTPESSCAGKLSTLTQARKLYANGGQRDYFDEANCIGFVRYGNFLHPVGLACIMSNAGPARKRMYVGQTNAGEQWTDILEGREENVTINSKGYGTFPVAEYSVSVWVNYSAEGRESLHHFLNEDIYQH
ncbi:glycoside hydrolase superfamily [Aspergillus cavernicola]|uniref:Glycoside hydrolase superfamily n=1 Tax=Aspergillus cavernicola TaxID=176166 RepID=A0ABR4I8W6_9EURO